MPADFSGLDPAAQQNLMLALDELRKNRIPFNVTSAFRSPEKQAELWANRANNPYPVAKPGSSFHERGLAADIALTDEKHRTTANRILSKYGWIQPLPDRDRVHYQFATPDAQRAGSLIPDPGSTTMPNPAAAAFDENLSVSKPAHDPIASAFDENLGRSSPTNASPITAAFDENLGRPVAAPKKPQKKQAPPVAPTPTGLAQMQLSPTVQADVAGGPQVPSEAYRFDMTNPGQQLSTFFHGVTAADNAVNAAGAQVGRALHEHGPAALFRGETYRNAGAAGERALVDFQHAVPPTTIRETLGLKPGKANRVAYDAAASLDYIIGGLTAPSNAVFGPAAETLGPPIRAGVGKVVQPLLDKAGQVVTEHAPGLAHGASLVGQTLGIGKGAAQVRAVATPLRHELTTRLHEGSQIVREMAAETVRMRKANPAFDAAETQFAKGNGGGSRLQSIVSLLVGADRGGASGKLKVDAGTLQQAGQIAQQEGIPLQNALSFAQRVVSHANETAATLERNGVVPGGSLTGPGANRGDFLKRYVGGLFGHPPVGAGPGAMQQIKRATISNMLSTVATDPNLAADVVGGAVKPGWQQIPSKVAFGPLAGKQVPAAVAGFLQHQVNPAKTFGEPSTLAKLGQSVVSGYLKGIRASKQLTLTLNPAGLVSSTGARVAAAEIALTRNGVPAAKLAATFPSAIKEWVAFLRTGKMSQDIAELAHESPAWFGHFATQIGHGGPEAAAQIAGTGGRIVRVGPLAAHLPSATRVGENFMQSGGYLHGALDQLVKVALFKSLRGKLGAAEAAKQVTTHLFDFGDQPALLELANRYGIMPFNAYPVKASKLLLQTITERPDLVARYGRLKAMLLADVPNAQKDYNNLPDFQKTPLTLPIGGGKFVNATRYLPFGDTLEMMMPEGGANDQRTLGDKALGKWMYGPAVGALGFNRDVRTGKPVAPPGTPPGEATRMQTEFARRAATPPLIRGAGRVSAALRGETTSSSRFGEAQGVGASLSQSLLNLPVYTSEGKEAKQDRLTPQVERRFAVGGDFVDKLDTRIAGGQPMPETKQYHQAVAAMPEASLHRELQSVRGLLHQRLGDPTLYANGKLNVEGQRTLRQLLVYLHALADRLDAGGQ